MGFGSGGGFAPSPNNVPGSTKTGTDKDTDVHQFTGSVDITGSLKLNGSSVTGGGGGGGAVANYTNSGNNRVVTSVDSDTINGEAGLTFNGSLLAVTGALVVTSSAQGALLKVDHADSANILYVTGSGRVGIGTAAPDSTLEVRSTTTQQKWSYDENHGFTVTVGDDGETILAVSGSTVSPSPASDLVFDVSKGGDIFFRRAGDRLRFGISTGETIVQIDNANTDLVYRVHPNGGLGNIGTEIARFDASGAGAFLMSGTISVPGGNAPINFRDTATNIHSPGANRLALTAPTLEISGSTRMSGAFGSSAVETLTANAIMSANTGLSIIDASSSLAVNNTLTMAIQNGSFVGQEKKIRGIVISGSTGQLSTGIFITGSNIDAVKTSPLGLITLSSSFNGGPAFQRAGCVLVWGGTKWLPVGNYNFDINNTRSTFG